MEFEKPGTTTTVNDVLRLTIVVSILARFLLLRLQLGVALMHRRRFWDVMRILTGGSRSSVGDEVYYLVIQSNIVGTD